MAANEVQIKSSAPQPNQFSTPTEEIAFLRAKLEETQNEFVEFQESSRELEIEYETQIKQLETKNSEFLHQINRLELENDQLKAKNSTYVNDTQHKLNEYQQQIAELTALNTRLTNYVRELEQSNDDLERARRTLAASLEDFEGQLNQQIERNVLLENEVSEKEELECVVQRLKEEARDLRHELIANKNSNDSVRRRRLNIDDSSNDLELNHKRLSENQAPPTGQLASNAYKDVATQADHQVAITSNFSPRRNINGSETNELERKLKSVDSTISPPTTSSSSPSHYSCASQLSNMTPISRQDSEDNSRSSAVPPSPTKPAVTTSSRIAALNIVSDLLKKVGILESKISSAKKMVPQ